MTPLTIRTVKPPRTECRNAQTCVDTQRRRVPGVAGCPDIALPRKKKAVFIDGDFWHGYQFSKNKKRLPKKYWQDKIEGNIKRDKYNRSKLEKEGWAVLRVWEHEILKNFDETMSKIINFFHEMN